MQPGGGVEVPGVWGAGVVRALVGHRGTGPGPATALIPHCISHCNGSRDLSDRFSHCNGSRDLSDRDSQPKQ